MNYFYILEKYATVYKRLSDLRNNCFLHCPNNIVTFLKESNKKSQFTLHHVISNLHNFVHLQNLYLHQSVGHYSPSLYSWQHPSDIFIWTKIIMIWIYIFCAKLSWILRWILQSISAYSALGKCQPDSMIHDSQFTVQHMHKQSATSSWKITVKVLIYQSRWNWLLDSI